MTQNIATKRFATVRQAADLYPAFSQSSFRWFIFNENQNNFAKCVKRVGRKVLLDLDQLEDWINHNAGEN